MSACSTCHGGGRIWDSTDHEPWAMHIISDVDAEDYWEAWMRKGRGQDLGTLMDPLDYERSLYQCPECGRLLVESQDDPGSFYLFVPENEGGPIVTGPAAGDRWRHFLSGHFDPNDPGFARMGPGCVIEHTGKNWEHSYFETLDETKRYFFKRLEELRQGDLLESAVLSEFGKATYRWDHDDAEPAQEKWELYLSESEMAAVSDFRARHGMCKWYYPYPGDGPFSYEIIPSSAGLAFRRFRVTCRYCGAFVESDDGEISHGAPCKEMLPKSKRHYAVPIEEFRGDENG